MSQSSKRRERLLSTKLWKNVSKDTNFEFAFLMIIWDFAMFSVIVLVLCVYDILFPDNSKPKPDSIDSVFPWLCVIYSGLFALITYKSAYYAPEKYFPILAIYPISHVIVLFILFHSFALDKEPGPVSLGSAIVFTLLLTPFAIFCSFLFYRLSKFPREYDGDDLYLVTYGGEDSSTKKMDIEND